MAWKKAALYLCRLLATLLLITKTDQGYSKLLPLMREYNSRHLGQNTMMSIRTSDSENQRVRSASGFLILGDSSVRIKD